MDDLKYCVALSRVPLLATVRFRRLEAHFRDLGKAWAASLGEFKAAGIEDAPIKAILADREGFSPDAEMEKLWRASVKAVTWSDAEYPWRLKEIPDPPPVLYIKGTFLP